MARRLYVAYFTGSAGTSLGLFLISDGLLAGADVGGLKYDGELTSVEGGGWQGSVKFLIPAGRSLISGLTTEREETFIVPLRLPSDFGSGTPFVRIETPGGPINARFEFIREIP